MPLCATAIKLSFEILVHSHSFRSIYRQMYCFKRMTNKCSLRLGYLVSCGKEGMLLNAICLSLCNPKLFCYRRKFFYQKIQKNTGKIVFLRYDNEIFTETISINTFDYVIVKKIYVLINTCQMMSNRKTLSHKKGVCFFPTDSITSNFYRKNTCYG